MFGKPAFAELLVQPRLTVRWRADENEDDLDDEPDIDDFQRVEIRVRLVPRLAVPVAGGAAGTDLEPAGASTIADELVMDSTERAPYSVESSSSAQFTSKPTQLVTENACSGVLEPQPVVHPTVNLATTAEATTTSVEQPATPPANDTASADPWATPSSSEVKAKASVTSKDTPQYGTSATSESAGYYSVYPPYYTSYESYASTRTPPKTAGMYNYYTPRQYVYPPSTKGHARRATGDQTYTYTYTKSSSSRKSSYQYVYDEPSTNEYEFPRYAIYQPRPPPYKSSERSERYHDVPAYYGESQGSKSNRPRPAMRRDQTASKPSKPPKPPAPKIATEEDARKAAIPKGYSVKSWDPTEEPILLLGSVFDANSLGKWIYDWTEYNYGAATPLSEVAGELWLLLIQLAGKMKRAEDIIARIRNTTARDIVEDFLDSGERLWQRFNKLLRLCENYMWKAAKKESKGKNKVQMGKNSGIAFVESLFGKERELERTEKLMTGMRLWSMRFDANCDEILRHPDRSHHFMGIVVANTTKEESIVAAGSADKDEGQHVVVVPDQPDAGDLTHRSEDTVSMDLEQESAANVSRPSSRSTSPELGDADPLPKDVQPPDLIVEHAVSAAEADTKSQTMLSVPPEDESTGPIEGGSVAKTHKVLSA